MARSRSGVVLAPDAFRRYLERYEGEIRKERKGLPAGFRGAFERDAAGVRRWVCEGAVWKPYEEGGSDVVPDLI